MSDEKIWSIRSVLQTEQSELRKLIGKQEKELVKLQKRYDALTEALNDLPKTSWHEYQSVAILTDLPNLPCGYAANIEKVDALQGVDGKFYALSDLPKDAYVFSHDAILTDEMLQLLRSYDGQNGSKGENEK